LKQEWVVVSPHRTQRPWQGQTEETVKPTLLQYDPACYLCPGNTRAGGHETPKYAGTYVFENDFAALKPDVPAATMDVSDAGLLRAQTESGVCRVLCFDPRHDLTLATMEVAAIRRVVEMWAEQAAELGARPEIAYVQIFENRGAMMGASNPHPHGQIWATEHVPDEPLREADGMAAYAAEHGGACLLCDYAAAEIERGERVVCANAGFVALVPWWAVWPFEVLVLPVRHVASMNEFDEELSLALADILKQVTSRYDALFATSFPYTMGFHQCSEDMGAHFHAHFFPPLLRSATVRKFMVGFEMLGMPQRDITPETAAERLRAAL
jgi:UDPglucose--hexose-1-phosphate uridylyltransferase